MGSGSGLRCGSGVVGDEEHHKEGRQKPEPGDEQTQIVAGGGKDGADGIALGSLEMVSFQQAIAFEMADDRFDGISPPQLAPDCRRDDAAGMCDINLDTIRSHAMATIAPVDIDTANPHAGDALRRATVSEPGQFRSGRQFAAWLGLVPKQNSSGDRQRLGGISKQGDRYLRRLLVVGATAVIRYNRGKQTPGAQWLQSLLEKKPVRLVSVALANKTARIVWALLARGQQFSPYRISAC